MIGAKLNSRYVGAATACLVALALFIGPLCTGMCAGSKCVVQAANSNEETGCHRMAHGKVAQLSAQNLNGTCRAADASFAVAGKPDFSVKCGAGSCERKALAEAIPNIASGFAADSNLYLPSDDPPLRNSSSNVNGAVLRI
jgi:hypothetical protein